MLSNKPLKQTNSICFNPLPIFHIYAFTVNCVLASMGVQTIIHPNPRDLTSLVKELKKYNPGIFIGINTLFNGLLQNKEFCELGFLDLKIVLAGGMAVTKKVTEDWFHVTGVKILEGYGLSETSPVVTG